MTKRRFRFQSDSSDDDDVRPMTDEEKRQYELKIRARKTGRYHERKRQAEPAAARLDGFSDDVFVRFASYLTAAEMVSLQLSSRAFGLAADGATVVEEAARQLHQSMPMSEYERRVFTKHEGESYVEFYHHFLQFRSPSPLAFRRLIGSGIEYSTESRSCVHVGGEHEVGYRCAIGNQVMRAGRHFAAFEASSISSDSLGFMCYKFGVMRPISNGCAADLARFNPSRIGFSRYIESEIQLGRELLLERASNDGGLVTFTVVRFVKMGIGKVLTGRRVVEYLDAVLIEVTIAISASYLTWTKDGFYWLTAKEASC
mmetsp:Transcript_1014/g.2314  ORF Transcript_1014/g.2314 Transcript_1014/m.2314 type:complete len:314 (-) Transcript_1014:167-1108(-)